MFSIKTHHPAVILREQQQILYTYHLTRHFNSDNVGKVKEEPLYTHTCFVLCPVDPSDGRPHMIYMGKNGNLKGGTMGTSFLTSRQVKTKQFLTTKLMHECDFDETLHRVLRDVSQGQIDDEQKNSVAIDRLRNLDTSTKPKMLTPTLADYRYMCELYVITMETPWPDDVQENWEPPKCLIM